MEKLKKLAAGEAVKYVKDGMIVGLGTGSTAMHAIKMIGEMVRDGIEIVGIPTSKKTEEIAVANGIKIGDLNDYEEIDVTIDGADQIDKKLNLIKGGGGALLREKIVASCSKKEIIIADESKLVEKFSFPLPVEVIPFGWRRTMDKLKNLGFEPNLRHGFITDNGNYIIDCKYEEIAYGMEEKINNLPGVAGNGLFINMADMAIIAFSDGKIKKMRK